MALPVPPTPDFSDKKDEPLSEIEVEVKRYMAQRNYDVEQLNKTLINDNQASSWLKPQETSLKAEKLPSVQSDKNPLVQSDKNPLKYIKIDVVGKAAVGSFFKQNVKRLMNLFKKIKLIHQLQNNKKKVLSWADERTDERTDEIRSDEFRADKFNAEKQIETNIFSKLKTIPSKKDELADLKEEMKVLHQKLDLILNLMNKK